MNELPASTLARNCWPPGATTSRVVLPIALLAKRLLSRRAIILAFFVAAGWLAVAGWLRPPFSGDVRALYLSLGIWPREPDAEALVNGARRVPVDSIGVVLLATMGVGAAAALWRPRYFGVVAGLLLIAALCANAAAALNHPALIYLMDLEFEQRVQIAHTYQVADNHPVTNLHNDRIVRGISSASSLTSVIGAPSLATTVPSAAASFPFLPAVDQERGSWERGLTYLLRGPYLILLALAGVLRGYRGTLGHRLRFTALCLLLGVGSSALVCCGRLRAEYYWQRAKTLEACCELEAARSALESCCSACPAFGEREETWLLAGKLDFEEGRVTPARHFFRAFQAYRGQQQAGSTACLEDLSAWPVTQTTVWSQVRWAVGAMEDVLGERTVPRPAAANQAARFWTQIGLAYYLEQPILDQSGLRYMRRDRGLAAAMEAWRRASELSPANREPLLYQGLALARSNREHPQCARDAFQPLLDGIKDRPLRADMLATLGDCYMEAGKFPESLIFYGESGRAFTLPKIINHRTLNALGGW